MRLVLDEPISMFLNSFSPILVNGILTAQDKTSSPGIT